MSVVNLTSLLIPFFSTPAGKKYVEEVISGKKYIVINIDEVYDWNNMTAPCIVHDAVKYGVAAFKEALGDAVHTANPSINANIDVELGFIGERIPFVKIHEIASEHIGKLVKVRGTVNQTHFIKPMAVEVMFKCRECGDLTPLIHQESPFALTMPPRKCGGCEERVNYDIVEEMSVYIDSQEFTIQESHEDVSGRIPQRIKMIIFKRHLINRVNCGDLVDIFGLVRLVPTIREGRKSRFNIPYIEVVALNKYNDDPETLEITPEEEAEIIKLSKDPNIYNKLVNNLAPSIAGHRKCKEAGLLAMVGGVTKVKKDITIRGSIHVLYVGDPSTAKSQLLTTIAKLSPRGLYSSGQGVSGVGLTAALKKDPDGEWVINAGVLVLADKGVACIDEIDKMDDADRVNIHEAMAQQTVTIDKAGLHTSLMARTAVIAAANPLLGRYDESKSVFENLSKFPPTLFSRFDLIFILIDRPEPKKDEEVLAHIENEDEEVGSIDRNLIKKYIAYAKTINPKVSPEAKAILRKYFLEIRAQMKNTGVQERIPITYRQYEALLRICEAYARLHLRKIADTMDAEMAKKLFNEFLEDIEFDVEQLETGKSKSLATAYDIILNVVKRYQTIDGITRMDIINRASEINSNIEAEKFQRAIDGLQNDGVIMEISDGRYRTTS